MQLDWLAATIDYGIIGLLALLSVVVVAIAMVLAAIAIPTIRKMEAPISLRANGAAGR